MKLAPPECVESPPSSPPLSAASYAASSLALSDAVDADDDDIEDDAGFDFAKPELERQAPLATQRGNVLAELPLSDWWRRLECDPIAKRT